MPLFHELLFCSRRFLSFNSTHHDRTHSTPMILTGSFPRFYPSPSPATSSDKVHPPPPKPLTTTDPTRVRNDLNYVSHSYPNPASFKTAKTLRMKLPNPCLVPRPSTKNPTLSRRHRQSFTHLRKPTSVAVFHGLIHAHSRISSDLCLRYRAEDGTPKP